MLVGLAVNSALLDSTMFSTAYVTFGKPLHMPVDHLDGARLCLAWAHGPAHVAHAHGQYRHLSTVHTASALVSGLLSTWN